jgi:hypothetical protein
MQSYLVFARCDIPKATRSTLRDKETLFISHYVRLTLLTTYVKNVET